MDWDELAEEMDTLGAMPDINYRISQYRRRLADFAPGELGRAEFLSYLGDDLKLIGEFDEARQAYDEAIADGGRTVLEPHAGLLAVALAARDEATVTALLGLLMTKSRADELVVGDYEWIAEALEEAGRLREALRWFTIPLRDLQPGELTKLPIVCLNGRWRVRRSLGLPLDAYDDAYGAWRTPDDPYV